MDGSAAGGADALTGWRLVGSAAAAFMLPLALAGLAAFLTPVTEGEAGQSLRLLAGVGGLVLGGSIAVPLCRALARPDAGRHR